VRTTSFAIGVALVSLLAAAPVLGEDEADGAEPGAAASGETADSGAPVEAGATVDLRSRVLTQPSFWTTLRAQYEVPTSPIPDAQVSGLRTAPARLTLREAVLTAIKNNPGIIADSLTPVATGTDIEAAYAEFDPIFETGFDISRTAAPSASRITAGLDDVEPRVSETNRNWDFSLAKKMRSGGVLDLDFLNNRFTSDAVIFAGTPLYLLSPQYQPQLVATLNQPLLRDFGLYFTSLRIRLAETSTDASIERYRAGVANFILSVVTNYWAVVGLEERLEVLRGSLELAEKTVRDNRTRVDVGVLPPVAVLESEAEEARRKEDVIVATNDLAQAKRRLRQQVYLPGENPFFPQVVEPVDRPEREAIQVDTEEAVRVAIENRPEIQAARLTIKGSQLNVALNDNQLLPRVDFVGSVGLNSLSGTNTDPANPAPFQGDYGDALNRLPDGRYYSWLAGVRIEVPIGNAGAKSQSERARVEQQQAYDRYRQTVSEVSLEVGQSAGDVTSDMERIGTTRIGRELSEENLRNQTKRYEVGMVTTTDLLQFQNDLAAASVAEIQALIEYNISRTEFERAQGTLLSRFNVEVSPRGPAETPWWARF
jgi:outer membrane protein